MGLIVPLFWRLEVQDEGVCRVGFLWGLSFNCECRPSPCVLHGHPSECFCVLVSPYKDTIRLDEVHSGELIPTSLCLSRPYLQIQVHSEIWGVNTTSYEFWGDTIQPIAGDVLGNAEKKEAGHLSLLLALLLALSLILAFDLSASAVSWPLLPNAESKKISLTSELFYIKLMHSRHLQCLESSAVILWYPEKMVWVLILHVTTSNLCDSLKCLMDFFLPGPPGCPWSWLSASEMFSSQTGPFSQKQPTRTWDRILLEVFRVRVGIQAWQHYSALWGKSSNWIMDFSALGFCGHSLFQGVPCWATICHVGPCFLAMIWTFILFSSFLGPLTYPIPLSQAASDQLLKSHCFLTQNCSSSQFLLSFELDSRRSCRRGGAHVPPPKTHWDVVPVESSPLQWIMPPVC